MKSISFYWGRLALTLCAVAVIFAIGLARLNIEADILVFMPKDDPVLSDALHLFENHPIQDQIVIDVSLSIDDPDRLLKTGQQIETLLQNSGLFRTVGLRRFEQFMPELAFHLLDQLPFMFSADQLESQIKPLLKPESIRRKMTQTRRTMLSLDGIGQSAFIAGDPLGLKDLVMARLVSMIPSESAQIRKGQILSSDGGHLLIICESIASGTDTVFARDVADLTAEIERKISHQLSKDKVRVTLMPMGAYRFALDNERIIKKDVHRAIGLATLGIVLLLIFTFPRPQLGLLSLLPATAGAAMAIVILSLLHDTVALMVLGFGGALISISVDHGIAYLLFLDRPYLTYGRDASREVWAVGLIAVLTTVGAFAALSVSGFPILVQLGQFTALGIAFSFLFVHTVFPRIFPAMPPANTRKLPLQNWVDKFSRIGKTGAFMAAGLGCVMILWAKPEFNADLSAMNTVSAQTSTAEAEMARIWGRTDDQIFLMVEAAGIEELQNKGDQLFEFMRKQQSDGVLADGFVPSMIFPGPDRQRRNLADWRRFWNPDRIKDLKRALAVICDDIGFKADAFEPFYRLITPPYEEKKPVAMPPKFFDLMGIVPGAQGSSWQQISTMATGPRYQPEAFYAGFRSLGTVFDPNTFSERLGQELFSTFLKMLAIIGISVAILLFFFFFDLVLTLISLLPVLFALSCTLGTLKLIGHPLDLPGLMLAIVVIGMGIDYSLFLVRSYQRYEDPAHPHFGLIRTTVFLASASTIIGFGVLVTAQHNLLKSAGVTSVLGIVYSLLGAFLILPPLLQWRFDRLQSDAVRSDDPKTRVLSRYRRMEAYPRIFAYFKLRCDPMFTELDDLLKDLNPVDSILDIGCGYGVPVCWMLDRYPGARAYGIDPSSDRVNVAMRAVGRRGEISKGGAPEIPPQAQNVDLAMLLDMIHFLDDDALTATLDNICARLNAGGSLIIRATIAPVRPFPWVWWFENLKLRLRRVPAYYREPEAITAALEQAGFQLSQTGPSGSNNELGWFIAKPGNKS